jgi:hypothetical protein
MKTKITLALAVAITAVALINCGPDDKPDVSAPQQPSIINPVPLPTNIVPGFNFPEDSTTIYSWLNTGDTTFNDSAIYAHAWGIWAGLTAETNQVYGGVQLRVFETWLGVGEIRNAIINGSTDLDSAKQSRTLLTVPSQVSHHNMMNFTVDTSLADTSNIFDAVTYNLPAAQFAVSNSIFKQDQLNTYYRAGQIGVIPAFPNNAITLKPTYFIGKPDGNLIRIPVWLHEPPAPRPYGPQFWGSYVYADTTNGQQPGKNLTPVTSENPTAEQIAAATCNLSDFIYFEMDTAMAHFVDSTQEGGPKYVAGDLAILCAMHVATKEISNWTWQTFYWDVNPSAPQLPGTDLSKPSQLMGAPAHYSAVTAYGMLRPNQPISGGSNNPSLRPVLGYSPYLEAPFNAATFSVANTYNPSYQYGVQTNCMSCHAMASFNPVTYNPDSPPFRYSTDQYINMSDTALFNNNVQMDFAWSILANIIPEQNASK